MSIPRLTLLSRRLYSTIPITLCRLNMSSQMFTLEEATWAWINTGPIKHKSPIGKRFLKGFMAGLFLSMGGMLVNILSADPWLSTNAPGLLKIIQGGRCFLFSLFARA